MVDLLPIYFQKQLPSFLLLFAAINSYLPLIIIHHLHLRDHYRHYRHYPPVLRRTPDLRPLPVLLLMNSIYLLHSILNVNRTVCWTWTNYNPQQRARFILRGCLPARRRKVIWLAILLQRCCLGFGKLTW